MTQSTGLLPYWLVYVCWRPSRPSLFTESLRQTSLSAFIHSIVCYVAPVSTSLRQFSGPKRPPPTQLLAHVYSVKNIYTAAIRGYAAYDIKNGALYDLAILTYIGVLWLFVSELAVYGTVRWREAGFPFVNAGVGFLWMVTMRAWYVSP